MATPVKVLLKKTSGVLLNIKGSTMIVRLSCATIGLGIIILKRGGISLKTLLGFYLVRLTFSRM